MGYSRFQRRAEQTVDTRSLGTAGVGTLHSLSIAASQFSSQTRIYYTITATLPDGSLSTTTATQSLITK